MSVSDDGTLRVWDLESGNVIHTITALPLTVIGIDFSESIIPDDLKETLRQNGAIV